MYMVQACYVMDEVFFLPAQTLTPLLYGCCQGSVGMHRVAPRHTSCVGVVCWCYGIFFLVTKSRGEWESDSGRTLTLQDVNASELSKVELQALQRVAVNQLQSLDIPVSHGLIRGVLFSDVKSRPIRFKYCLPPNYVCVHTTTRSSSN